MVASCATGVAHVRFQVPDLGRMTIFLERFGFVTRTCGDILAAAPDTASLPLHFTSKGEPAFLGFGFYVADLLELRGLAERHNVAVEQLPSPGEGWLARLVDPDGMTVEVVVRTSGISSDRQSAQHVWNVAARHSRIGSASVERPRASRVVGLGHVVLNVSDLARSRDWYVENFGLLVSDVIEPAPGMAIGAFMRCNLGEQPADHHSLFLLQHPGGPGFNHAAFEVEDFDDLMRGHDHLKATGESPHWGIGRHILGNQVFDYWTDPWGHVLEHWTDGDRLTANAPMGRASLEDLIDVQWGPAMPAPR